MGQRKGKLAARAWQKKGRDVRDSRGTVDVAPTLEEQEGEPPGPAAHRKILGGLIAPLKVEPLGAHFKLDRPSLCHATELGVCACHLGAKARGWIEGDGVGGRGPVHFLVNLSLP